MKYLLVLSLFITTSVFAQAEGASSGNEGGNGGDVIICKKDGEFLSPMLLDFFEANRTIRIPGPADPFEKVRFILNRVAKHDPVRARLYQEGLDNFLAETFFVRSFNLPDIQDEGWIPARSRTHLGKRCVKRQAVIQVWKPEFDETYESWNGVRANRYYLDKNLWEKMDDTNKAGLIIHELLVREGVNLLGTTDTKEIRKMNRYWTSSRVFLDSQSEYEYKIQKLGFEVLRK